MYCELGDLTNPYGHFDILNGWNVEKMVSSCLKDTLKAFDDFKNKRQRCMKYFFWTPGRADRGPINSVPSVRPFAMGICRECFIQFFRNLA